MARYRPHHSLGRRAAIRYFYRWTRRHFSTRKTCKHQKITDAELIALLLSLFVFKVPHASIWWSLLREDRPVFRRTPKHTHGVCGSWPISKPW